VTRIAQLTPYPTRQPRHGGQLRAHHAARALEAAGHVVERISVFSSTHYPPTGDEPAVDLAAMRPRHRWRDVPQVADMTLGDLAATDAACFAALSARLDAARAELVMLEEPWLWPGVRRWRAGLPLPPPVIFNAYNIESRAKAKILADAGAPEAARIVADVDALERDLAGAAAGVTATTAEDAAVLREWTAATVVVARNGTVARQTAHLHGILPAPLDPQRRYVLFVGSAHPPNASGFLALALPALPVLRSTERIVVAGDVCTLLAPVLAAGGPNFMLRDRLVLLGPVGDLALDCLLGNAAGILLPITYGGGSNLKTAEALISGLPVVGTSQAFRGFAEFADRPRVTIADTPDAFAAGIRRALEAGASLPAADAGPLLWDTTLRPLVDLVASVAGQLSAGTAAGRAAVAR
jgi:glycosyltransferase involved in cell wall biosynthesis